jgi:phosphatidylserine/phosphatidylglycerophosphate/cardiolipin synthase-like enzyme
MIKQIPVADDITLVISRGEHGFQAVIDSFPEAKQVTVVTYNVSNRDAGLLDALKTLRKDVTTRIVTNIPTRFSQYFGDAPRSKARSAIQGYLQRLNPVQFQSQMKAFFQFENHCKLVATDTIAYVGSANFSNESADNIEAGVLIMGTDRVREIVDAIFEEAVAGAIEHTNNEVATAVIQLSAIKVRIDQATMSIHEVFFTESDPDYQRSIEYFNWDESPASREDLDAVVELMDDVQGVLANIEEVDGVSEIVAAFNGTPVDAILHLVATDGVIDQFVAHDPQFYMQGYIEETIYDD